MEREKSDMSAEPAPANPAAANPLPPLYEILTGEMGAKYGALPVINLPQEDELLIAFAHAMGEQLADKGLYRRDRVIVIPNELRARLDEMTPEMFCSWSQLHVVTSKIKHDRNGEPFPVYKDMPTDTSLKVLVSVFFYPYIEEIEEMHPVPMPKDGEDNDEPVTLRQPGFDGGIFTFQMEL